MGGGTLAAMGMEETMGVTMTDFVRSLSKGLYAINVVQVDPNWIFGRASKLPGHQSLCECVS